MKVWEVVTKSMFLNNKKTLQYTVRDFQLHHLFLLPLLLARQSVVGAPMQSHIDPPQAFKATLLHWLTKHVLKQILTIFPLQAQNQLKRLSITSDVK